MASNDFWKGMVCMAGLAGIGAAAFFGGKKAIEYAKEKHLYRFCDDDDFCWCDDDDDEPKTDYVDADCNCGCDDEKCECENCSEEDSDVEK